MSLILNSSDDDIYSYSTSIISASSSDADDEF